MKFAFPLLFIALLSACAANKQILANRHIAEARQMILVLSPNDSSTTAQLQRFEQKNGQWQQVGQTHPVILGRTGLAYGNGLHDPAWGSGKGKPKREGDGKSPAGVYALGTAFGYATPEKGRFQMDYVQANAHLECVDDPHSKHYNALVDNQNTPKDWNSSEWMLRQDAQYKWGVMVLHNAPDTKAMCGSCIFLHIWESATAATAGCTAMSEENLLTLMHWLDPRQKPILVQLTVQDFEALKSYFF